MWQNNPSVDARLLETIPGTGPGAEAASVTHDYSLTCPISQLHTSYLQHLYVGKKPPLAHGSPQFDPCPTLEDCPFNDNQQKCGFTMCMLSGHEYGKNVNLLQQWCTPIIDNVY